MLEGYVPWENSWRIFFAKLIKTGSIEIETAGGHRFTAGDGSGAKVGLSFKDRAAPAVRMLDPELNFGELHMAGRVEVTQGTLFDLLMLSAANPWRPDGSLPLRLLLKLRSALRWLRQPNSPWRARRNAAYHYDLDAAFYTRFLDSGLHYSCAYFERDGLSLNRAACQKRHIAAKLILEPGHSVLDIGCDFGGMAIYLARFWCAGVTGITLFQNQHALAQTAAADLGLSRATGFRLCDDREVKGRFDRIVSVGMFEHVGLVHYDTFFRKVADLLDEDGIALIHTIGRVDGPCATNPWVAKYIFPGGYMPALSELMPVIERTGLFATDIEILRLHYAQTIRAWRERFAARRGARMSRPAKESVSAGYGNSTLLDPRPRSCVRDLLSFRSSWPRNSIASRSQGTISATRKPICASAIPPPRICGWRPNRALPRAVTADV
ncbi:MAG: cyclopropane-fatty-acyl-phospholipid synthase family protein [Beijerinckiaceae bacterium]|nr:cyclopropane-fatty-acyl-phospholipid synthase family protein [Beijerinckiaceae bacterium]MCI0735332.1 cyclopropane-fatty-acyl-phospholipid synthase family protein [Beijerinckiaceae bacterium]